MKRECVRCGRGQSDVATICSACIKSARQALTGIADNWRHLTEAITRQTRMQPDSQGRSANRPLPVNIDASRVADSVRNTLVGWVRVLCEDNHLDPPANTVAAICAWLDSNHRLIRRHEAAADCVDELIDACGMLTRAIDYPDDKARIFVGPCPETDAEGDPCPGEIHAIIPERESGAPRMECRVCGSVWASEQWTRMGVRVQRRAAQIEQQKTYGRIPDEWGELIAQAEERERRLQRASMGALVSIDDAARHADVTPSTLRRWVAQGVVKRHGESKPWKVDLDRVMEVRDALRAGCRLDSVSIECG